MALFNYATKEITLKIVYYGPGLSGKTTNLQYLHSVFDPSRRGRLLSLSTEADRTLFFDFLPVELGKIKDFSIRFQLYTVPGQVRYNATRRLVLKGADAVVFVADSQKQLREQNLESLRNMRENLLANNLDPEDIPLIYQYNKRDLKNIMSVDDLNRDLNAHGVPFFEAVAIDGIGVKETFEAATRLLIKHIARKHKIDVKMVEETPEPVPVSGEEVTEQPHMPPTGREAAPVTTEGPDASSALRDITSTLRELKVCLDKVSGSIDSREAFEERLYQYELTVEKLNKAVSDTQSKQDEIVSLLKDVKAFIDDAKAKKRWVLFG